MVKAGNKWAMIAQKYSVNPFGPLLRNFSMVGLLSVLILESGCHTAPRPGAFAPRAGDEIVVAGQMIHTGTRVLLWMDPGGYDAYRVERRFSPFEESGWEDSHEKVKELKNPNRYSIRKGSLTPEQIEKVRGGGWDLPLLQSVVDQFVLHFDVCGTSRQCFNILQDHRDLSVHFMLDLDGTIYQTLDLKERAWHATTSNTRSVGIEIANMGSYSSDETSPLADWYRHETNGQTTITIPERFGNGGIRTPGFVGHPARPESIKGEIQGRTLVQYDYTPEQYAALAHLTATLCKVFPKITCDYPKDAAGKLIPRKLADDELENYHGVMGHYHIQTSKVDPGPALQWDYLISTAQRLMTGGFTPVVEDVSTGHARHKF
ncbi:MAG: N-acetyl-anhydromuranmyl-L-alanine amidase [Pedosphaera sp.]|nr:N-acetyl-anhydromuranmyl-L-alanine amidase [Pedosphaera sp.]